MIFLLLMLVAMAMFVGMRYSSEAGAYMSRAHTNLLNGFFIVLVFLRHFCSHGPQLNACDMLYVEQEGYRMGQLIVATFFFFSGFGMQVSFEKKGLQYARDLVRKRFAGLLLSFASIVLVYLAVQALLGNYYSFGHVLLSLCAWSSVGNPSWFIFMTLSQYLILAFCYVLFSRMGGWCVIAAVVAVTAVWLFVIGGCKPNWYVNTMLCVPGGMVFAMCRGAMQRVQQRCGACLLCTVPVLILAGQYLHVNGYYLVELPCLNFWVGNLISNMGAVCFAVGMALVAGWLSLRTPAAEFTRPARFVAFLGGPALFYIYMLHMLPLMLGRRFGLAEHGECYLVLSLLTTALLVFAALRINAGLNRK